MSDAKPCEACASKASSPSTLEQMRFDYAWKWFEFHAEQRTKMFNYMLIGMGIFATAFVAAVDKKLGLEAAVLSTAAVVVALVFVCIDARNRQLYLVAMDVLIDIERSVAFPGRVDGDRMLPATFLDHKEKLRLHGVSSRVAHEDLPRAVQAQIETGDKNVEREPRTYHESMSRHLGGMGRGQHRYWMPFVGFSFATLFLAAATRSWLMYANAVPFYWVLAEGGVLIVLGIGWAITQYRSFRPPGENRRSSAWPIGSILVGIAFVVSAACFPKLRDPFTAGSDFEIAVGADLTNVLDLRLKQPLTGTPNAPLGTLVSAQLGPFGTKTGDVAAIACDSVENEAAAKQLKDAITDARNRGQRVAALLVGSVDTTRMTPEVRHRYPTGAALARARVAAAEACLWGKDSATAPHELLRVFSGPAYTPATKEAASANAKGKQADRSVGVLILGL